MNITALKTFLAIVDTGSLVRASQVLHVTQSTVTARLKSLEDELGQQLLNRQKSGTTLTPAGTRLLSYARIMTGLWQQAKYETGLPAGLASVCTFGCDRELWHGPGWAFFSGMIAQNPDIAVSVRQGSARDLDVWLSEGAVDVIMTYESVTRGAQTVHALPPETIMLCSDRPDTLMDNDPLYVFVDHGEDYRRQHAEDYHDAGVARISFDSSWWALQCILDRGGSAYLPETMVRPYLDEGKLYPVANAPAYQRKKNLIVNDASVQNWAWFPALIEEMRAEG